MLIYLFLLWIMLSGRITLEIIVIGLLLCLAISLFAWKVMGYHPKQDLRLFKLSLMLFQYVGLLVWEVVKANVYLARIIFSKKIVIEPALYTFTCPLRTGFARAILANSITLTPGTITISQEGNKFTVHGLRHDMVTSIPTCSFVKLLTKMEALL